MLLRSTRIAALIVPLLTTALLYLVAAGSEGSDFPLKNLEAGRLYALTVSVDSPYRLSGNAEIEVAVSDSRGIVASKTLHAGDLDLYLTLRSRGAGNGLVRLNRKSGSRNVPVSVDLRVMELSAQSAVLIAAQPNSTWQEAQEFELGQTIFGSNDERPFIPAPSDDSYQALLRGFQWFRFTYRGSAPKLAFFTLDVLDREVPVDIEIFQKGIDPATGKEDLVAGREGQFAYVPEATQNFPGMYKFRTRLLKPGETYFIRVAANHPSYQLRTSLYDPPPYADPKLSVRAGMDFLINMGDSWHANTPRRGSTALRSAMAHSETQLCIACHPTQFTTRGYLTAVKNGYPATQRPSLKFLIDRLYNNPRPLYGLEDTQWVRVIYSARTVASRLPAIFTAFEKNISSEAPRLGLNIGFGNYLRAHYHGLQTLPGEEADGCSPNISPFEIAAQSWQTFDLLHQQTADNTWREERDRVENLTLPAPVRTVIDLNWKITALAWMNREKHQREIEQLVEQLYSLQKENGMWGYQLDPKSRASDFISLHALYALAVAGKRPESDPRMAQTVEFALRTQRREGGWMGDPVYKGFNTPFRDTQFAVMALSQLYPGPGGKGWGAAFPPAPQSLNTERLDIFLSEVDQIWEMPSEIVLSVLRETAASGDQPLAREAALAALGRVADPKAVGSVIAALSASTKVVQATAAWALREIAVRRGSGRAEIARALSSGEDRGRWGASRVFNQHFRELTSDFPLLDALARNLDDPVPHIRYQTAGGLSRWYYWQVDSAPRRARIIESLCARMGREDHPLVRRGLMEGIYNILDENTGYFRAWVKAGADEEDRRSMDEGYREVVRHQAQLLARALKQGNTRTREGILTALWDFHTRHMAIPEKSGFQINLPAVFTQYVPGVPELHRPGFDYAPYREAARFKYDVANGFQQTRIGNDSELIHFYSSSGPDMEEALLACLETADTPMKINILKAGHTLSEAGGAGFARAVLRLSFDPDPKVREAVRYVYERGGRGILNIEPISTSADERSSSRLDGDLAASVVAVLKSGGEEGLAVLLPLLSELESGSPWSKEPSVQAALRTLVDSRAGKPLYGDVLKAASSFPALLGDSFLQTRVTESLKDRSHEVRRAGIQVTLHRMAHEPALRTAADANLSQLDSVSRGLMISELSAPRRPTYRGRAASATGLDVAFLKVDDIRESKDLLVEESVLKAVSDCLSDRDGNIRAAALDLVARRKDVQRHSGVRSALEKLRNDPAPRLARLAAALLDGKDASTAFADTEGAQLLDFDFFVQKVQPIFTRRGPDGMACVVCHESHVILKLMPPDYNEQYSETRSRENFRYALGVVNVAQPEQSLLLIKPTRPTDSAGDVQDYLATHNGGHRWAGNEKSAEYQTILVWIRGAKN